MGKNIRDLTGQKFGKLTVISLSHVKNRAYWLCKCDCGNERVVSGTVLTSGNTLSCGCKRYIDIAGKKFGMLTVIKRVGTRTNSPLWECLCDCGNTSFVTSHHLLNGNTKSCGCTHYNDITGRKFGKLTAIK